MFGQWNPLRLRGEGSYPRVLAVALLVVYAAATLYVALHHEPWRDEADSWLVVRDLPLTAIVTWTRNAGTPALWYVLLKPLIWLGLPYQSQQFLHLAMAWAAAGVLLLASPFPLLTRALIAASYFFAYEYAVIARSYVLTVLLSFLIAAWYGERDSRPLRFAVAVALLFNANVHGAIIAAVALLLFLWPAGGRRPSRPAVLIMLAGAVAAWAQLRTAPDAAYPQIVRFVRPLAAWEGVAGAFFPGQPLAMAGTAAVALILLIALALRRQTDALLFGALSLLLLCLLYVFVWFGGFRHAGLLLLVVIVALWIARDIPRDAISMSAALLFHFSLLVSAVLSVRMAQADVKVAFSGSREMGDFIRTNRLDRYEIAAHNLYGEATLPWVPGKELWYAGLGRYGTYMLWNLDEQIALRMPYSIAVARAVHHFAPKGEPWLLLLNAPMPESMTEFQLLYTNRLPVFRHPDERYWLYEWKGGGFSDQSGRR